MRRTAIVLAVAICGLWLPTIAGDAYVGASYLNTSAEFKPYSTTYDASSSGWKIFVGYNFMKYFGVELTYYDLGSFDDTQGVNSIDADIQVFDLCGRGILPLGKRFELFARLGYSTVDVDVTETLGHQSGRDWELLYGIGAALKLGKKFGIRVEYEGWDVDTSLDAWSLGGYFRFGGK